MSIVKGTSAPDTNVELTSAKLEDVSLTSSVASEPLHEAPVPESGSGTLHLNLSGVFSADDLARGVTWKLKNFDVGKLPSGNVIIDNVSTTAIGSNVSSNLMLSANLFNAAEQKNYMQSGVTNTKGWVTNEKQADLVPLGFAPILNIMPNEYSRTNQVHYQPASSVDDSLMQRYGHLSTGDSLRNNIVPFPGEDYYYVAKDHVVLDIIERNWDALGQDVSQSRVREGNWIKVSDKLVDKVLDELNTKVLRHMPLTNLKKLQFKMRADKDLVSYLDKDQDYPVTVTLNLAYRSTAPELSA